MTEMDVRYEYSMMRESDHLSIGSEYHSIRDISRNDKPQGQNVFILD